MGNGLLLLSLVSIKVVLVVADLIIDQLIAIHLICLWSHPTDSVQRIQRKTQTPHNTSRHGRTVTRTNTGSVCLLY